MDNKLSLDTGGLYLMREHANIDPVYGPYDTIQDAEDALTGDYAEVVKPGLQFAVSDGNGKYKQYIVNSLDPFDYSEIGSDAQPFEVGDTQTIRWSTDASGEHYADIIVGSGLAVDQYRGLTVDTGAGLCIGTNRKLKVAIGSGLMMQDDGEIAIMACTPPERRDFANLTFSTTMDRSGISLGRGLFASHNNGLLELFIGSGLRFGTGGQLEASGGSQSIGANDPLVINNDSLSLMYEWPFNNHCGYLSIKTGYGISVHSSDGLIVNASSGLYFDGCNSLAVKAGHGIASCDGVSVIAGRGLGFDSWGQLEVKTGNGLDFGSCRELNVKVGGGLDFNGCQALIASVGDGLVLNYGKIVFRRKDNSLVFDGGATKVNLDENTLHLDSNDKVSANIDNDSIVYSCTSQKVQTKGVAIQAKQGADWSTVGTTTVGSPKIRLGSGILAVVVGTDAIQFDLDTTYLDTLYQRVS